MSLQSKDYTATAVPCHGISQQWDTFSIRSECYTSLSPSLFILSRGRRMVDVTEADDQMFHLSWNATVQHVQYNYTIKQPSSFQCILQVTFRSSAIWKEYQITLHDLSKINHKKGCTAWDSCLFLSFMRLHISPSRSWRCAWTENWNGALWESWTPLHLHTVSFSTETFFLV